MKAAKAVDFRRRLETKKAAWGAKLTSFAFEDLIGLGGAELSFKSPVTLITGPNGVGKSTLLRVLWATLDPKSAGEAVKADNKLKAGSAMVVLETRDGEEVCRVTFGADGVATSEGGSERLVTHINSASDALRYQAEYCSFSSAEEIINGVAGYELKAIELACLNAILKRDYRAITLYEVEMNGYAPFFEVSYGDDRYDSRTMGAGEISAFHIWWKVNRCEADGILLMEEPEAFLSHGCQVAIAEFITKEIVEKRLCTVISSHAAPLIAAFPQESLQFLSRGAHGLDFLEGDIPPILLKSVGIDPPLLAVCFVEDAAAKAFCRALLERSVPALSRQIAIEVREGDGGVSTAVRATQAFNLPFRFVGLYDGDIKGRVPNDVLPLSTFLPGDLPIEELFRLLIKSDVIGFSAIFGDRLGPILNGLEGLECHDWYANLARETGLSRDQIFPPVFQRWISIEANAEAAALAVQNLIELVQGR